MILDSQYQELIRHFFELKVIDISVGKPFEVGEQISPLFFDLKRVYSDPQVRELLVNKWVMSLESEGLLQNRNICIAGTATAGVVPGFAMAEKLGLPFVYANLTPTHCSKQLIEGVWTAGTQIVLVDDFVATGKTITQAVDIFRQEGGQILFATSIARHDFRQTRETLEKVNVELHSLFRMTDVFDVAYGMSLITSREMRVLMEWLSSEDVEIF